MNKTIRVATAAVAAVTAGVMVGGWLSGAVGDDNQSRAEQSEPSLSLSDKTIEELGNSDVQVEGVLSADADGVELSSAEAVTAAVSELNFLGKARVFETGVIQYQGKPTWVIALDDFTEPKHGPMPNTGPGSDPGESGPKLDENGNEVESKNPPTQPPTAPSEPMATEGFGRFLVLIDAGSGEFKGGGTLLTNTDVGKAP